MYGFEQSAVKEIYRVGSVNERIGATARRIRLANGWTLEQIADRSGGAFKLAHLGLLERGERRWHAETIEAVAEALGVPPAALLEGGDDDRPPPVPLSTNEARVIHAMRKGGAAALVEVTRELAREDAALQDIAATDAARFAVLAVDQLWAELGRSPSALERLERATRLMEEAEAASVRSTAGLRARLAEVVGDRDDMQVVNYVQSSGLNERIRRKLYDYLGEAAFADLPDDDDEPPAGDA